MNINYLKYYSRKDIQNEILRLAKNREVQGWFNNIRGSRPEILNYFGDIETWINNGLSSIHVSEERWYDPLNLKPGMKKSDLNNLRCGWDFVIDLDSTYLSYSLIAGELLVEALKFHDIENYSIKFSGNHGVHIGICYEAFPKEVNGQNIKDFFPDGLKIIVSYLKDMIKDFLAERLLKEDINDIAINIGKNKSDLIKNKKFDPFTVVDIDTILISSRHMFRAVYSINEKSGLVSIPLKSIKEFKLPKEALNKDFFPPCILKLISGIEDGKKRGIFILINYLQSIGWCIENIEKFLLEWNKTNKEPLRDNYLIAQINWFKTHKKAIMPPNCDNSGYYKAILICNPDSLCNIIKNPVNYSLRKKQIFDESQPKKKERKPRE